MEKKIKSYFWTSFNFSLLFGLISGGIYRFNNQISTSDWASKGQPFSERWLDKQIWLIEGFIPGAIFGIVVGILWVYISDKRGE
ncbi:MAG: hypothetical protein HND53_00140 [Proteobacteria bacterium]|nr:hypothetical protein [Pseudomonadota bacterium]NOG58883.1 hypothetical protein [Pseudomonadota bacterium]